MTHHFETPTDDEREALTYLITAFRFGERGLRGVILEPDLAVSRPLAEFLLGEGFRRSEVPERPLTLEDLSETSTSLKDLVGEARSEAAWCCDNGCGSGGCETCPCCSAGYCVSGFDGVPDDPEDREHWLEVAAEYNPVAAALRTAGGVR